MIPLGVPVPLSSLLWCVHVPTDGDCTCRQGAQNGSAQAPRLQTKQGATSNKQRQRQAVRVHKSGQLLNTPGSSLGRGWGGTHAVCACVCVCVYVTRTGTWCRCKVQPRVHK